MHRIPLALPVAVVVALAVALPLAATAQNAPPAVPAQPPQESQASLWQQDTLTGDWGGLRSRLKDSGITLGLQEQSEVWGVLSGGRKRGAAYDGLTTASLQLDLGKLVGWSGATLFANGYQIHGRGPSIGLVGGLQLLSGLEATDSTKLYDLWFEQTLLDGRLSLRLGQEGANDEFMLADDALLFINSSFGFPPLAATDLPSGAPNFPLATPFVRLKYQPSDAVTMMAAVFNGDPAPPGTGDPQLRDRNGVAFRLNDHVLAIAELGYARNKGEHAEGLPATYKFGAWWHSARFNDVLVAANGVSLADPAAAGGPLRHTGDFAIYGIVDQTVWRPADKNGQGIALFLEVMGAPGNRNLSNFSLVAGLNWKAPFAGRDNDAFGLGVTYEGISPAARRYAADLIQFGGGLRPYASNETIIEATYQYQVAPWWTLQPDAQYVINPGAGVTAASAATPLHNAFVLGLRTVIVF